MRVTVGPLPRGFPCWCVHYTRSVCNTPFPVGCSAPQRVFCSPTGVLLPNGCAAACLHVRAGVTGASAAGVPSSDIAAPLPVAPGPDYPCAVVFGKDGSVTGARQSRTFSARTTRFVCPVATRAPANVPTDPQPEAFKPPCRQHAVSYILGQETTSRMADRVPDRCMTSSRCVLPFQRRTSEPQACRHRTCL